MIIILCWYGGWGARELYLEPRNTYSVINHYSTPLDLFAHNINFTVICWQWGMRSACEIILEDVFHLIE